MVELDAGSAVYAAPIIASPERPTKRSLAEIGDSEADEESSDSDYGWDDEDMLATGDLTHTADRAT